MTKKTASLRSEFSVDEEIVDNDTRFLKITIDLMHTGENLNGSFFTKEAVDSCIDSVKNIPVLGFIRYKKETDENDFKGHEHVLARTKDGVEEHYIGSAYGVVPETCNPRWVTKMCGDSQEREFLQIDALLWEKFSDATSILRRDGEKSESMEVEISSVEGHEEDGLFYFDTFRFDGACILGDDVQPAMVGANVVINDEVQFAMSEFAKNIQSELNDKLEMFNKNFTKLVNNEASENQGGVSNMPNTNKDKTEFAQTVMEQFADISEIVSEYETTRNRWGDDLPRYHAVDIQDDEVIVVDRSNGYFNFGFPFTIDGDKPVINFAGGCRKKVRYENYEDGAVALDGAFDFGKHIAEIEDVAFAKVEDAGAKLADTEKAKADIEVQYSQVKADYDDIKPKYDEYAVLEESRKTEEVNAVKDAKFAEYEDVLCENVEFTALKENKDDMSIDDIEKECAVLYVKATRRNGGVGKEFSADVAGAVVDVLKDDDSGATDGFVHTKYGDVRVSR